MGRTPAPVAIHRLSLAEQRVLSSFINGRLPAGQVHTALEQARAAQIEAATQRAATTAPTAPAAPAVQPVPAVAA